MLYLAQEFSRRGHKVDLILARYEGAYVHQVQGDIKTQALKKTSRIAGLFSILLPLGLDLNRLRLIMLPRFLTLVSGLKQYLNQNQPHVIITALHNCNLSAIVAGRCVQGKPLIVVTEHIALSQFVRSVPNRRKKLLPSIKNLYPLADGIVAVSDGVRKDLSAVADIPAERIDVIFNPVITDQMTSMAAESPGHPWLNEGEHYKILAVGRLAKQKDYVTLIRAFQMVKDVVPAKLIILGEGKDRGRLEALITDLKLSEFIDLPGFMQNPFVFMAHSDLFVMSSIIEGLPTVLFEAMASGCEVISTDCPYGPSEILQGGKYGTLVPANDPKSLADAIVEAYEKKPRFEKARDYARQFTAQRAADQYLQLITELGGD